MLSVVLAYVLRVSQVLQRHGGKSMRLMRLAAVVMIVLGIATVLTLEQGGRAPERVVTQVDSALQVAKQAVQQAQNATQHTN
jgi:hypothetical protein